MTNVSFRELGIAEPLLFALQAENYVNPTPIQAQAIPHLLAGKYVLGIAQTGTGKTAAFGLPILQHLAATPGKVVPKSTRALILAPTRELVLQIADNLRTYGRRLQLRHAAVLGGVGLYPQIKALARGVDVLVATPGRLLDLAKQGHVRFDQVGFFVLDEADRMLDMGFIRDVRKIVGALPRTRQSLLFSATMPGDVAALASEMLRDPVRVAVTPVGAVTLDAVDQRVYFVEAAAKRALLSRLLADPSLSRVIVFTRTKHGADRVAGILEKAAISVAAIHGNKSQGARQRALDGFRSGGTRVLVATDIASRGIDIDDVTHVINFELPNVPENYVHRIGRTARAGASGIAISFCDSSERPFLRDIESVTRRRLARPEGEPKQAAHEPRPAEQRHQPRQPDSQRRRAPHRGQNRRFHPAPSSPQA